MTDAPSTSSYILRTADTVDLPASRILASDGGISLSDEGGGGKLTIGTTGSKLATLNAFSLPGFIAYDTTTTDFEPRSLVAGQGINITNPTGQANPSISVAARTTNQLTIVQSDAVPIVTTGTINFLPGDGSAVVTVSPNISNNSADVLIDVPVGAANDATYIVKTPTNAPPNSQKLSALVTGILKSTTATGVVSIAVSGTDYLAPSANLTSISAITPTVGILIAGNGTGFSAFLPSAQVGDVFVSGGTAADPIWVPGDASGKVFTSNGPGLQPSWEAPGIASGAIVLPSGTTSQTFTANNAYIPTASSTVTFSLPVTLVAGDSYEIRGFGSGGWTVPLTGGRTITIGNQTPATTSVSSILATDSIIIFCVDATHLVANIYSGQLNLS